MLQPFIPLLQLSQVSRSVARIITILITVINSVLDIIVLLLLMGPTFYNIWDLTAIPVL